MNIEGIQISAFVSSETLGKNALKFFEELFPNVNVASFNQNDANQSQAQGTLDDHQLIVVALPDRIDLHILPQPTTGPGDGEINLDFVERQCREIFAPFAGNLSPLRLAFVVNAASNASDLDETIAIFEERAEEVKLPTGTTEIDFKVNVPRKSKAASAVAFNVLHRLHTVTAVMMTMDQNGNVVDRKERPQLNEQLDVNTAIGSRLEASAIKSLYDEMISLSFDQIGKSPYALGTSNA